MAPNVRHDDEIHDHAEAARFLRRSEKWLRNSNVPRCELPGRGEGKRVRDPVYLKSELVAYARRYLTHSVAEEAVPQPRSRRAS
jgi:hypothetical protein